MLQSSTAPVVNNLDELLALNLPIEHYAIAGSGPLAIRGIRENRGLDVVVDSYLWDRLTKDYLVDSRGIISVGEIEFSHRWFGHDVEGMIYSADIIGGLPYVSLPYTQLWKAQVHRTKDALDLFGIEQYIEHIGED